MAKFRTNRQAWALAATLAVLLPLPAVAQQATCPSGLPPAVGFTQTCTVSTTANTTHTSETLPDKLVEVVQVIAGTSTGGSALSPGLTLPSGVAAVTTAGGPGVLNGTRTLQSQTDVTGVPVVVETRTSVQISESGSAAIGPGTILIGPLQSQTFFVDWGTRNFNTNTHTETFIHDQLQTTITRTSVYAVGGGVVQPVGLVHAAVQSAGFDAASGLLARVTQQAGGIAPPAPGNEPVLTAVDPAPIDYWLDFYGSLGVTPDAGSTPGDTRAVGGLDAGFRTELASDLSLAAALNHSITALSVPATSEEGMVQLTQAGVGFAKNVDDWLVRGALVGGFGQATTTTTLGGTSTATYGVRTAGALIEIGRSFDADTGKLTPLLGADLTLTHTDAFTGSGGAALSAPAHDAVRLRAWLGLEATASWLLDQGTLSMTGRGRIVGVPYGAGRTLAVTFAGLPGTPLTITGAPESPIAVDLGGEASLDMGAFDIFASYDAHIQPSAVSHSGRAGLRGTF